MSDPYSILGLKRGATDDEIKQAYKSLARKCHPDKGGSAEEFKKINEAYTQLMNKDPSFDFADIAELNEIFKFFGTQFMRHQKIFINNPFIPKGQTIHANLEIDLETYEKGTINDEPIEISYNHRVSTGRFVVKQVVFNGQNMIMEEPEYKETSGTTKVHLRPCEDITNPILYKNHVEVEGARPSDLLLNVKVKPHELYKFKDIDLYLDINISLKEALTGFVRKIKKLNSDEELTIDCESIVNPYEKKVIEDLGLKAPHETGNLIITFYIQFPVLLEADTKEELKKLLPE